MSFIWKHLSIILKCNWYKNALLQIRAIDESACFNMLCALEGAIQGIRWHGISKDRKEELKQFLKMKDIPI